MSDAKRARAWRQSGSGTGPILELTSGAPQGQERNS